MKKIQYIILLVLSFSLAACGGGGSDLPAPRPSGSVNGVVHDAPVTGATIKIYAFANGVKGSLLGETKTLLGEDGSFTMPLQAADQPILVEATGGQYTEEASGTLVTIGSKEGLKALSFFSSGKIQTINLTPFTMLAAGLAESQIASGVSVSTAIQDATNTVSALVGEKVDVVATMPLDIQTPNDDQLPVVNATALYGFTIASFSSYSSFLSKKIEQNHRDFSSFALTKLMYEDIRAEGVLDGLALDENGEQKQLVFAEEQLNQDVYFSFIARHMLTIANSPANKTGITAQDLLENSKRMATNNTPEFPGLDSEPLLEVDGPTITAIEPKDKIYSGSINFAITVEDKSPIFSVVFTVDNFAVNADPIVQSVDVTNPAITIDTNNYSDGQYNIEVTAVDELGNSNSSKFIVIFENKDSDPTPTPPNIAQLEESALPYSDAVNKNEKGFYTISELESNGLYAVSLTELTGNVNLAIFTDDSFSSELCSSVQISLSKESCVINASVSGQLHIVVDSVSETPRASFLLNVKPVIDLSNQLPVSNTIKAEIKQFVVTGLTPSTAYTVELTGLNDNDVEEKRDDDLLKLIVSDNQFATTSCASKRDSGAFFRDNQGCIATSNVKGELYIGVEGVPAANNESGSMDYTLSLDGDNTLIDMTTLLPQDTDISRLITYHKVTGLDPAVPYMVGMETYMFGPYPALSVYTSSNFDDGSRICSKINRVGVACTAMPNANGCSSFPTTKYSIKNYAPKN